MASRGGGTCQIGSRRAHAVTVQAIRGLGSTKLGESKRRNSEWCTVASLARAFEVDRITVDFHTVYRRSIFRLASSVAALARLVQQGPRTPAYAENIAHNVLPDILPGRLFYTRLVNGLPVFSLRPGGPSLPPHTYDEFARVIVARWMRSLSHRMQTIDPGCRFLGVGSDFSSARLSSIRSTRRKSFSPPTFRRTPLPAMAT